MTWRYRFTFWLLALCFLVIILRLFYWQVVKASELSSLGQEQYGKVIKLAPIRGQIYTSDGFPIVANRLSYTVFANPKITTNKNLVAITLAPILKTDTASISA